MRLEHAVRTVMNLRRYRQLKSGKTQWYQAGPFVPQIIIPYTTRAQRRAAENIIGSKGHRDVIRPVDVRKIRSWQHSLRFKSLMWNVKHHRAMQRTFRSSSIGIRAANLPILVYVGGGVFVLWNGNHRTTANILLGKTHILAKVVVPARGSRAPRGH